MMRFVIAGLAVLSFGSMARATVFTDADGSHDISSAAAWGGTMPTDADFTHDGDLTARADVSFGAFTVKDGAILIVR